MASNYIDFERMERLGESTADTEVNLDQKVLKVFEEGGELAQAILKYNGCKNASKSGLGSKEHILEEACDVMNVVADIINSLGFTNQEAKAMFDKKLDKWEAKVI